jgi:hypothetical protein
MIRDTMAAHNAPSALQALMALALMVKDASNRHHNRKHSNAPTAHGNKREHRIIV